MTTATSTIQVPDIFQFHPYVSVTFMWTSVASAVDGGDSETCDNGAGREGNLDLTACVRNWARASSTCHKSWLKNSLSADPVARPSQPDVNLIHPWPLSFPLRSRKVRLHSVLRRPSMHPTLVHTELTGQGSATPLCIERWCRQGGKDPPLGLFQCTFATKVGWTSWVASS